MSHESQILAKLGNATRLIRLQWAVKGAIRAALLVHVILIPLLLFKQILPINYTSYLLALLVSATAGTLLGLLAPLSAVKGARLLDAHFALKERLQSALEFRDHRNRSIISALLKDAGAKAAGIKVVEAFPSRLPRETRFLATVLALAVALLWLPPLPIQRLPAVGTPSTQTAETAGSESATEPKPSEVADSEPLLNPQKEEQQQLWADVNAVYRDTPFAAQPPDFVSFLEGGDESLGLLDPAAHIPDLQRDDTQDPFQVSVRRMPDEALQFNANQISQDEAAERMEQFESLWGRGPSQAPKGVGQEATEPPEVAERSGPENGTTENATSDDASGLEGPPSLTQPEEPERATEKVEAKSDGDVKRYGGGEYPHDAPGGVLPPWLQGPKDPHFPDAGTGEGEGTGKKSGQPGVGHAAELMGVETPRLDVRGQEQLRLKGLLQEGDQDSYDTDLPGLGAKLPSRTPESDIPTRYSGMAEQALNTEQVPLDHRERIKRYFSAIELRR